MEEESLSCTINSMSRFISANSRFAKALSIRSDDVEWRYFMDCFGKRTDWSNFRKQMELNDAFMFDTKLKRRKGRKFDCTLVCTKIDVNRFSVTVTRTDP